MPSVSAITLLPSLTRFGDVLLFVTFNAFDVSSTGLNHIFIKLSIFLQQKATRPHCILESYKEIYAKKLAQYSGMMNDLESEISEISVERSRCLRAVLRRGILSAEAAVRWCDETAAELCGGAQNGGAAETPTPA